MEFAQLDPEKRSQITLRDEQAEGYVERYLRRGQTFVQLDERLMLSWPKFAAGQSVLDAGSGVGYFAFKIAPLVASVEAFDFSEASLAILRSEAEANGIRNVNAEAGDLTKGLPYKDESFDRIISHQVLAYIPPEILPEILSEFHRVLKPGGSVLFSLFKFGWRGHFRKYKSDTVGGFRRYSHTLPEVDDLVTASHFRHHQVRGFVNTPAALRSFADRNAFVRPAIVALEAGLSRLPWSVYLGHFLLIQLWK